MPVPITPPEVDVRVVRSRIPDPELLADELGSSAWLSRARIVKNDDRSSVLSGEVGGKGVIVKTVVTNLLRSRAPAQLGRTKLARQWRGAELLIEHQLPTVEPVLMWSGRSAKGHHAETLVMERVVGETLLKRFARADMSVRRQHRLAEAVAGLTGRLASAGLFNRDHKPSNIIVCDGADNGRTSLVLIDTGGVTRLGSRDPDRMLFNLIVELVGTGTLPRRAVLMQGLGAYMDAARRPIRREIWDSVRHMLESHADPRPKDDPLKY